MSSKSAPAFVFIVHPRDLSEVRKKFNSLYIVPDFILYTIVKFLPPVVVAPITGLVDEKGEKRTGCIVSITMTGRQMLENKPLAKKHVIQAMRKAKSMGATHVGLGAFTSVVTGGGEEVKNVISGLHVTNGNALTAAMTYADILKIINESTHKPTVAVIGATGSIGSAVSELLAKSEKIEHLYVVGRTETNIQVLMKRLASFLHLTKVDNTTLENALPRADIVISATSAHGAVIKPELLKQGALVYDITQPKNIPKNIKEVRPDVTIIDGGLVELPKSIHIKYNIGLPKGVTFACMAETMLLALEKYPDNFCLGHVTVEQVEYAKTLADKFSFIPAKHLFWTK